MEAEIRSTLAEKGRAGGAMYGRAPGGSFCWSIFLRIASSRRALGGAGWFCFEPPCCELEVQNNRGSSFISSHKWVEQSKAHCLDNNQACGCAAAVVFSSPCCGSRANLCSTAVQPGGCSTTAVQQQLLLPCGALFDSAAPAGTVLGDSRNAASAQLMCTCRVLEPPCTSRCAVLAVNHALWLFFAQNAPSAAQLQTAPSLLCLLGAASWACAPQ